MNDLQRLRDAGLAHGTQRIQHGAADIDAFGAQRHRFEHVLPTANAAVHVHLNLMAHGINNSGQRLDGGRCAVELAAAMVGHDDGVGAGVDRQLRVFSVLDTLQDELASPAVSNPLDVRPAERRIELRCCPFRE